MTVIKLITARSEWPRWRCGSAGLGFGALAGLLQWLMCAAPAVADEIAIPPAACAIPLSFGPPVAVSDIIDATSLQLADGRIIRLVGIGVPHRPSEPDRADDPDTATAPTSVPNDVDPIDAARSELRTLLTGQTVRIAAATATPDRYGRLHARVERAGDRLSIERALVAAGLARVEPEEGDAGCARALEQVEGAARAAKRGIWASPAFAVIGADDTETRRAAIGRYVLIEGTVVSRGTSGNRHYLNFGRHFRRDFAIELVNKDTMLPRNKAKRNESRFQTEGFDSPAVVGKRVRVRGVLLPGGGGLIMPRLPEEIEWSDSQ
jgi:endonuclease YncB( thermonuclease family)